PAEGTASARRTYLARVAYSLRSAPHFTSECSTARRSMKRLTLLAALFSAAFLAACGGSKSNPPPLPPRGTFATASLNGHYALAMSGADGVAVAYTARVGSFVADGAGHITGSLEDVLTLGAGAPASQVVFSGGTYQILANGRGVMGL